MADLIKVTNGGMGIINNRLKNGATGATEPNRVLWGTGTTAADVANTALETPGAEAKVVGTSTLATTTTTNDTYQVLALLTCNATAKAITEIGLFDTADALFIRGTFSAINVSQNDSIQFTIKAVTDQA